MSSKITNKHFALRDGDDLCIVTGQITLLIGSLSTDKNTLRC